MSAAIEVVGTIGGVSIALSLIPQVIKTYKTKSAGDISYVYQSIYIFGCTLVNIYAVYLKLWPVYVPCLIEETLILTLTTMKYVYGRGENQNLSSTQEICASKGKSMLQGSKDDIVDNTGRTDTSNLDIEL